MPPSMADPFPRAGKRMHLYDIEDAALSRSAEIRMALSLKDPETDRLAREVARLTGESLTEAVRKALAERLERERLRRGKPRKSIADRLNEIALHCAALPNYDTRSPDAIIGYDENGM